VGQRCQDCDLVGPITDECWEHSNFQVHCEPNTTSRRERLDLKTEYDPISAMWAQTPRLFRDINRAFPSGSDGLLNSHMVDLGSQIRLFQDKLSLEKEKSRELTDV